MREGRSREITAAEAGAMGGSQVKEAFKLLRERASAHGHTVTEEIRDMVAEEAEDEETVEAR
jgi:gas vesicle protein